MKWYLMNEAGQAVLEGTLDEMFSELFREESDREDALFGPYRERAQNEGGGWECHPEGIKGAGSEN